MYDFRLGGKDHFEADRQAIAGLLQSVPSARTGARENRAFLGRAVRYLVAEAGIRQFLDIGSGLPTASNVHEVAQAVAPSTRVVYADNDPIVGAHARALLTSDPAGRTAYIEADLHDPAAIVQVLLDALPSGSYLVASQTLADFNDPTMAAGGVQAVQRAGVAFQTRTAGEFARLGFCHLELVPPGLVVVSQWRPEHPDDLRPKPSEAATTAR